MPSECGKGCVGEKHNPEISGYEITCKLRRKKGDLWKLCKIGGKIRLRNSDVNENIA